MLHVPNITCVSHVSALKLVARVAAQHGQRRHNHRCPWCGRIGAGGYAPDALFPATDLICTTGPQNCLAKMIILDVDRAMFRERQLHAIAQAQVPLLRVPGIALCIAGFL